MYKIKQTQKKYLLPSLNLFNYNIISEFYCDKYLEAVRFALHEQIKFIHFEKGKAKTKTNIFKFYYTVEQFLKHAKNNRKHFGISCLMDNKQIKNYYYFLIERNLTKLKKY
jgi:hypothetical protein